MLRLFVKDTGLQNLKPLDFKYVHFTLIGLFSAGYQLAATTDFQEVEIEDPEKYQVTLAEDGSYTMVADCNRVAGAWALEDNQLTLSTGPATLALCPDPSRGEEFVRLLVTSNDIDFDGDNLVIAFDTGDYAAIQMELVDSEQ